TSTPSVVIAANVRPGLTESEWTPPWPKIHGFSINTISWPASGEYRLQPTSPSAINMIRYFIDLPCQNQIHVAEGTVKPAVLLTRSVSLRHDRGDTPAPAVCVMDGRLAHLLLSIRRRPAVPLAQRPLRLVIFLLDLLVLSLTRHALRDEIPGAVALHDFWKAILRRGRYAVRRL